MIFLNFYPMTRNLISSANPDFFKALDVIQKSVQGGGSGGAATDAGVEADGHHLWRNFAFFVEVVEGVFEVGEKVVAVGESGDGGVAEVVAVQGVGDHQMFFIVHRDGVG